MSSNEEEATISLPSLAFVAFLGYFIYRYFISGRTSGSSTTIPRNGQRFTLAQVETVVQMFPQLNRRDIMWDLQRNGGSVSATTERILAGGGLVPAPPSFQPPIPISTPPTSTTPIKPVQPEQDLIVRYNLQSKVDSKGKEREDALPATGWAASKDQRQQMLQRRRDEMILAARRKMQERDEESAGAAS